MKNVDRIAQIIKKTGGSNMLIHSIPGNPGWLICQKITNDTWQITMGDPLSNVSYNLGIVSHAQHKSLWQELINQEINNRMSLLKQAQHTKKYIKNFVKRNSYKKFIKRNKTK